MKQHIGSVFSIVNALIPKAKHTVLFISSPDVSDNAFALFRHMLRHSNHIKTYIWLIENPDRIDDYQRMIKKYIESEDMYHIKYLPKRSWRGIFAYMRSRYIFFTHGFYTGLHASSRQIRINLWHGMPLKSIGFLNPKTDKRTVAKASYAIATSKLFQDVLHKAFAMPQNRILITGLPRCDLLYEPEDILSLFDIKRTNDTKTILWMPTFRRSKDHKMSDGQFTSHIPLIHTQDDLSKLNEALKRCHAHLIVKIHPMDILTRQSFINYSHITFITDEHLFKVSCQLNTLVGSADLLITDYSSVYIDYLLLDRPIIFTMDDFDKYRRDRHFVFDDPKKYMPGEHVTSVDRLIDAIKHILVERKDNYAIQRNTVKEAFHQYENNFSSRLLEAIGL
jgi:CDP-glycerol glycerophosphotransferase (TagB/SpsB family)